MFYIGALPALLALVLRALLPESPRWLAVHGRTAEADAALSMIERETQKSTGAAAAAGPAGGRDDRPTRVAVRPVRADLSAPHAGGLGDLVRGVFHQLRAGDLADRPSSAPCYKLPLDVSLRYGLITQAAGFVGTFICALTIDHVGRRPYFAVSFAAAAVSLGLLAMQPTPSAEQVLIYVADRLLLHQHHQHRRLSSTRRSFTRRGRARSASAPRRRGCASPR